MMAARPCAGSAENTEELIGLEKSMEFTHPMSANNEEMEREFEEGESMGEGGERSNRFGDVSYEGMKRGGNNTCAE